MSPVKVDFKRGAFIKVVESKIVIISQVSSISFVPPSQYCGYPCSYDKRQVEEDQGSTSKESPERFSILSYLKA